MRAKRVVLLSSPSLLSAGVQGLLQGVDNLELSVVAAERPEAIPMMGRLAPEVIVLDSSDASLGEGVVMRLLGQYPEAKVVALNINRIGIEVYQVNRVIETGFDGLLEAIQGRKKLPGKQSRAKTADAADCGDGGGTMGP